MTASGVFPKLPGDVCYSYDINWMARPIMQVYIGSEMNIVYGSPVATSVGSYVFSYIPVGSLGGAKYAKIGLTAISMGAGASDGSTDSATINFGCKHREISGAWSDVGPGVVTLVTANSAPSNPITAGGYDVVHELNNAELVSGLQIMAYVSGTISDPGEAGQNFSFTNKQMYVELK